MERTDRQSKHSGRLQRETRSRIALRRTALALLAATTGVCVGCEMYMLIARARGIVVDRHPAV